MNTLVILLAILSGAALVVVTFVQLLYLESLRLRSRERAALELFKSTLQSRIGVESDRGVLTFSFIKHTLLVGLGVIFLLLSARFRSIESARPVVAACIGAWLAMLAATYVAPHILYRRSSGHWLIPLTPFLRALAVAVRPLVAVFAFFQSLSDLAERPEAAQEAPTPAENIEALITAGAEEGLIEESDRELIQSVVEFGDTTVREVMTPRPNIVAIAAN